jgi:hypothetical protein
LKEQWADYEVWWFKGRGTFDAQGRASTFWGTDVQSATELIPLDCNPKIILLAERVAEKNRQKMDYVPATGVEYNDYKASDSCLADIDGKVASYRQFMTNSIKAMTHKSMVDLELLAKENNWCCGKVDETSDDYMWGRYNRAKALASSWLDSLTW